MYREKVQELQSEMINQISQKVSSLIINEDSRVHLPSSFRIDITVEGYDDAFDTETLSISSLGIRNNKVQFITQEDDYINLGSYDIYSLAWVMDQFIYGKIKVEEN